MAPGRTIIPHAAPFGAVGIVVRGGIGLESQQLQLSEFIPPTLYTFVLPTAMAAEAIAALTQAEEAARAALLSPRSGGTNPTGGDGTATPTEGNKGAMNTLNYAGDDEGGDKTKKKRSSPDKSSAGTPSGQGESRDSSQQIQGKSKSRTKERKTRDKSKKKRRSKSRRRSQTRSSRGGRSSRRGRSRRRKSWHSSEGSSPERRRGKGKKEEVRQRPSPVRANSRSSGPIANHERHRPQ